MSSLKQAAPQSQLQSNVFTRPNLQLPLPVRPCVDANRNKVDKLSELYTIVQGYLYGKSAQSTAGEIHIVKFRFEAQEMCGKNWNGLFKGKTLPNQYMEPYFKSGERVSGLKDIVLSIILNFKGATSSAGFIASRGGQAHSFNQVNRDLPDFALGDGKTFSKDQRVILRLFFIYALHFEQMN